MDKKLGFIGSGNMAEALIKGLLASGTIPKKNILVSDVDDEKLKHTSSRYGVKTTVSNIEVAEKSDIVVFAVKPNILTTVLKQLKTPLSIKKLYISIAAGVKSSTIRDHVKKEIKIARVMPNTPCLVLNGASALFFNHLCNDEDISDVNEIFNSVGKTFVVKDENLMNAVTGLSGSGPAYVSIFIEALSDAGVKMGLGRKLASELAAQTVFGTSSMIMETGKHPAEVKDMVSSPGGTTICGISSLEDMGFRSAVISAVESATLRSIELSRED